MTTEQAWGELHGALTQDPVFHDMDQGSDEWLKIRTGLLTASEIKLIMTPGTLKPANNDKTRAHIYEILAQRITGHTEESFISDDMLRGSRDEILARAKYEETRGPINEKGFVTRQFLRGKLSITLGFSPDGLAGSNGLIECKSRRQKYQIETAIAVALGSKCPPDYMLQIQTGMLVSGRSWCDFVSYSGGLPMIISRVEADHVMQEKILDAAFAFESKVRELEAEYHEAVESHDWPMTERFEEPEGMVFDDE